MQIEAYYLSKRCIIRQDVAFWHHLVDIGAHITTGKTCQEIIESIKKMELLLSEPYPYTDNFGSGNAVEQIINHLLKDDKV